MPLPELLANTAEADVGVTLLQDTCENHRLALPNKLFEYIAAGVPVVASALPETQRLIESRGIGWCSTPEDPDAAGAVRCASHCDAPRTTPPWRERLRERGAGAVLVARAASPARSLRAPGRPSGRRTRTPACERALARA